jgi:predicted metal-dependent hydrolase
MPSSLDINIDSKDITLHPLVNPSLAEPAEPVVVIRSPRRRRTISAQRRGGAIEIRLPAGMSNVEETRWIERMTRRLRRRPAPGDADLMLRAGQLSKRYFAGELKPTSVRWSDQQTARWGSCTVDTGAIRLSSRMRDFPAWVVDYVLAHELAHLRYRSHGPRFWSLVARYPLAERARGFLIAKGGEGEAD